MRVAIKYDAQSTETGIIVLVEKFIVWNPGLRCTSGWCRRRISNAGSQSGPADCKPPGKAVIEPGENQTADEPIHKTP